jgi:hypothetical protein
MNGPDLRRALLLFAFLVVGVMWALGPADVIARLGIRSVPTTCVIGKDGSVATSHSGFLSHDALASAIAEAQRR